MQLSAFALVLAAFLSGCAGVEAPVLISKEPIVAYDQTLPPSVPPPGFVPSYVLAGSVDIPAELSGVLNANCAPALLIGAKGEMDFRRDAFLKPEGKVEGSRYHFRGSVTRKDFNSACVLIPVDKNIQIEVRNPKGDRVRIEGPFQIRTLTWPQSSKEDYGRIWGEGK
jgi:hypothetical protein